MGTHYTCHSAELLYVTMLSYSYNVYQGQGTSNNFSNIV